MWVGWLESVDRRGSVRDRERVRSREYEKEREQKGGRKVQTGDNSFGGLCRTLGYVVVSDNDRKVL